MSVVESPFFPFLREYSTTPLFHIFASLSRASAIPHKVLCALWVLLVKISVPTKKPKQIIAPGSLACRCFKTDRSRELLRDQGRGLSIVHRNPDLEAIQIRT